jgi:hypothetical protein
MPTERVVDIVIKGWDQASIPLDKAAAGVDRLKMSAAGLVGPLGESNAAITRVTAGMDGLERAPQMISALGAAAGAMGLNLRGVGAAAEGMRLAMDRSTSAAVTGWTSVVGRLTVAGAVIGGVAGAVMGIAESWKAEAAAREQALADERADLMAHKDFLVRMELDIAKARGDTAKTFELSLLQGHEAGMKAIEEGFQRSLKVANLEKYALTPQEWWQHSGWAAAPMEGKPYLQAYTAGWQANAAKLAPIFGERDRELRELAQRDEELKAAEARRRSEENMKSLLGKMDADFKLLHGPSLKEIWDLAGLGMIPAARGAPADAQPFIRVGTATAYESRYARYLPGTDPAVRTAESAKLLNDQVRDLTGLVNQGVNLLTKVLAEPGLILRVAGLAPGVR